MLFEAHDMQTLRQKLFVYERDKNQKEVTNHQNETISVKNRSELILTENLTDCPDKDKGMKCYSCDQYEHIARNCKN